LLQAYHRSRVLGEDFDPYSVISEIGTDAQSNSKSKQNKSQQQQKKKNTATPSSAPANRYGLKAGAQPQVSVAAHVATPGGKNEVSFPTLLSEKDMEALRKAEAQKEKLLEYQRNSVARTKVHGK
jgi:hypothetical protein